MNIINNKKRRKKTPESEWYDQFIRQMHRATYEIASSLVERFFKCNRKREMKQEKLLFGIFVARFDNVHIFRSTENFIYRPKWCTCWQNNVAIKWPRDKGVKIIEKSQFFSFKSHYIEKDFNTQITIFMEAVFMCCHCRKEVNCSLLHKTRP